MQIDRAACIPKGMQQRLARLGGVWIPVARLPSPGPSARMVVQLCAGSGIPNTPQPRQSIFSWPLGIVECPHIVGYQCPPDSPSMEVPEVILIVQLKCNYSGQLTNLNCSQWVLGSLCSPKQVFVLRGSPYSY